MFEKEEDVVMAGKRFSYNLFMYLLAHFKEAFCHSSLTIEEAFQDLDEFNLLVNNSLDDDAFQYYSCLTHKTKKEITETLHQMIVFKGSRYGVFPDRLTGDIKQTEALYNQYFAYFEPYIHYYIAFDEQGQFDKRATYQKIDTLFINLPQRQDAYKKAYNMKKDHMDAFDYALQRKRLTIRDAIMINNIVNDSDVNKVLGYKITNNFVSGADFHTVDKKDVPFEMQRLFSEYDYDFGMEILDPNEYGLPLKERYRRAHDVFRKEAMFHIRFIHIHPFNDGNGRTGRIILNQHLLSQGMPPIILSDVMSEEYRRCINEDDVEGLAKLFFYSSSLQLANWVSLMKTHPRIHKKDYQINNKEMAEMLEYEDIITSEEKNKLAVLN